MRWVTHPGYTSFQIPLNDLQWGLRKSSWPSWAAEIITGKQDADYEWLHSSASHGTPCSVPTACPCAAHLAHMTAGRDGGSGVIVKLWKWWEKQTGSNINLWSWHKACSSVGKHLCWTNNSFTGRAPVTATDVERSRHVLLLYLLFICSGLITHPYSPVCSHFFSDGCLWKCYLLYIWTVLNTVGANSSLAR